MDGATTDQFLRYVQGLPVSAEITNLIDRIVDGNYVPPGLDCTLQGIPQKHHLMYKIEPLDHPSGRARYEFLVEYDRYEPHVGIMKRSLSASSVVPCSGLNFAAS